MPIYRAAVREKERDRETERERKKERAETKRERYLEKERKRERLLYHAYCFICLCASYKAINVQLFVELFNYTL